MGSSSSNYDSSEEVKCEFNLTWKVNNFKSRNDFCIKSPYFPVPDGSIGKCYLTCFPYGINNDCSGYLSVYFQPNYSAKMSIKIAIINKSGEKVHEKIDEITNTVSIMGGGFDKFIERKLLANNEDLLPGENLIIHCGIHTRDIMTLKPTNFSLSDSLQAMLLNPEFSDFRIIVDGTTLPAHKVILASRSPVFAVMLATNMKESLTNQVEIVDLTEDVVKEMLNYIYTGETPNIKNMASELLHAANKYELLELQTRCESSLLEEITIENALSSVTAVDTYSSNEIKLPILHFITINIKKIRTSGEWEKLLCCHPHIINEVITQLAQECGKM